MTPKQRILARRKAVYTLVELKAECGRLGLYKTMQVLDTATDTIGWELEELMEEQRCGKPS